MIRPVAASLAIALVSMPVFGQTPPVTSEVLIQLEIQRDHQVVARPTVRVRPNFTASITLDGLPPVYVSAAIADGGTDIALRLRRDGSKPDAEFRLLPDREGAFTFVTDGKRITLTLSADIVTH